MKRRFYKKRPIASLVGLIGDYGLQRNLMLGIARGRRQDRVVSNYRRFAHKMRLRSIAREKVNLYQKKLNKMFPKSGRKWDKYNRKLSHYRKYAG